jgi:prepilin-type N-terminal cleavage/methylation domain-containing protein
MMIMRRLGTPRARRLDSRRGGFTLIEVLMALSIVAILASLAIPNYRSVTFRARATEVAGDLEVIRIAALSYNADAHTWPVDAAQGVIPPVLIAGAYLPEGFGFQGNGFELKYENFSLPGGLPGDPTTTQLIAVSVTIETDELSNAVVELLGGAVVFSVGLKHTVVIDRS